MLGGDWRTTMKSKEWLIACAMVLISLVPAAAGGLDLSTYGTPVDAAMPVVAPLTSRNEPANKNWPAHVCAEIQRVEGIAVSGPLAPTDRGTARGGLLLLEQLHCGIDVSRKMAADRAVLEQERQRAGQAFEDNMEAAAHAFRYREPVIVQVPQADPEPAAPAPTRTMNCLTSRLGGGMSTTTCR
jgi:hypothetical protein